MNNKNEVKNDDILNMMVQENNIDTEAIIKCELFLERIFFPKYVKSVDSGEFAIFSGYITKRIENCPETLESIKLKGTVPTLEYGTTYKVFAKFENHHDLYGDTYSIVYMNKCVDISSKDKQKEFLRCVLNENLVEKLFEKYEDVIELLENKDVEALTSVKGIGNQVALKMIDEYNRSKDYSQVYIELGQMGFTDNFIRKLVEFYHSPDVAIDKVKNNPYDLVRIDGVGFKKADEIGCKAGIDKFSPHRIKAFLYYTLDEQGEAGRSYLLYQELMKTMYDTLGFIPEEVISEVAKRMIDNGEIVVLDNGNKISLRKYYNLEKNIMNELIRLQIGKIDIVETEEDKDEDYIESELHKDYVPKIFNTSDWEDKLKKIEEVQGFEFTDEQKAAVELSINNNVIAITGGAGCVDCDTEFFNGYQWKKISEYNSNDKVLQYNKDGTAELVYPSAYIKQKADYLWHFETKYGLDQCLSDKHNCYYITSKNNLYHKTFKEVRENQEKNGFDGRFITSFKYEDTGINLSDFEIRLMIAIFADGSFYYNVTDEKDASYNTARFHLKKERKKQRLLYILNNLEKMCRVKESAAEGYTDFYITAPFRAKHFPVEWYKCNKHQKEIIMDEVLQWDSYYKEKNGFCTTDKSDADFIQFVFTSLGYRSTICTNDRRGRIRKINGKEYVTKSIDYVVSYYKNILVGMCSDNRPNYHKTQIEKYKTSDGYEYCFTVPSHILVLRRNDKIFITGNCGKSATSNAIIKMLQDNHKTFTLFAPTGRAAKVLSGYTKQKASTIQRGLGFKPPDKWVYNEDCKLFCDVLIIDEFSMTDIFIAKKIFEALDLTKTKLLIIGDNAQLPSVSCGNLLHDFMMSDIIPTTTITRVFRYGEGGLMTVATDVRNCKQYFKQDTNSEIEFYGKNKDYAFINSTPANIIKNTLGLYKKLLSQGNIPSDIQVLTAYNKGEYGTIVLNNHLQKIANKNYGKTDYIKVGEVTYYVGDIVIQKKNNYEAELANCNRNIDFDVPMENPVTFIANGEIGIITEINGYYLTIDFNEIGRASC